MVVDVRLLVDVVVVDVELVEVVEVVVVEVVSTQFTLGTPSGSSVKTTLFPLLLEEEDELPDCVALAFYGCVVVALKSVGVSVVVVVIVPAS